MINVKRSGKWEEEERRLEAWGFGLALHASMTSCEQRSTMTTSEAMDSQQRIVPTSFPIQSSKPSYRSQRRCLRSSVVHASWLSTRYEGRLVGKKLLISTSILVTAVGRSQR